MENKMINIAELLRDMTEGIMLYSPACGKCKLEGVTLQDTPFPIAVDVCNTGKENVITRMSFTKYGQVCDAPDANCLLFPSEKMRDWSKFFEHGECPFKPFDKVLVRDAGYEAWVIDLFSYYKKETNVYVCMRSYWEHCIPYNEHTAHLLGTSDPYEEEKGGDK